MGTMLTYGVRIMVAHVEYNIPSLVSSEDSIVDLLPTDSAQAKQEYHTNDRHSDEVEGYRERDGHSFIAILIISAVCTLGEDAYSDQSRANPYNPRGRHIDGY